MLSLLFLLLLIHEEIDLDIHRISDTDTDTDIYINILYPGASGIPSLVVKVVIREYSPSPVEA